MASPYNKSDLKNIAWYVDDNSLGIVKYNNTSGEWDSLQDSFDVGNEYLQVYFHSRYPRVTSITQDIESDIGLPVGLHQAVIDYVKSRLFEDIGDLQKSQYFLQKYMLKVKKFPFRRSSVRGIKPFKL